jgi:hypothetical protein
MTPEPGCETPRVDDVSERLPDAYATAASDGGIALYGTARSLARIASCIRDDGIAGLASPPPEVVEGTPLDAVRVVSAKGPVELRVVGRTIEVAGDCESRAKLAASVENLTADMPFGGVVARHVDVEHFPGHGFLSENSTWMTVTLLAIPDV